MYYHSLPSYQPGAHPLQEPVVEGSRTYWDESVYYQFDRREIDEIEQCTNRLNECCLQAVQHVIDHDCFAQVGIGAPYVDWVKRSWSATSTRSTVASTLATTAGARRSCSNTTPTRRQAFWKPRSFSGTGSKIVRPLDDQFNSIHEKLIDIFRTLRTVHSGRFYFAALAGNLEDFMTVNYLRDCAMQASWDTEYINVEDIGWHAARGRFTDLNERPINLCFKLYPWEWMTRERFGRFLQLDTCLWFEPPWKMVLSNKGILVLLRELFPDCPYLLDASFEPLPTGKYVRKPIHGREGHNIQIVAGSEVVHETAGPYDGPCIYQELWPLPNHDGNYPVLGSWLVNGYACGMGIREDTSPITQNTSRFVPHIFS